MASPDDYPVPPRLAREKKTVLEMIRIYCRNHHHPENTLCEECAQLRDYAVCRLERCPFGAEKPTCAKCPIHCYKPAMRERVREVMGYAGPRMVLKHPILAIRHQLDGRKEAPEIRIHRSPDAPPESRGAGDRGKTAGA